MKLRLLGAANATLLLAGTAHAGSDAVAPGIVSQSPEKAAADGSPAWQRDSLRVGDQTHRLPEKLCG